ncbi:hypothetical protein TSAR_005283 [Trichomalopsis sarcophagae]|uniref:Akirin n=1 Tax=Trichomalopsis sarcophagae TaxID=543379 RepID=A0A232EF79_9HYME|nr:hypothetical protein TSAR_005283 [Trichomalopsis sarcophagae]
MSSFYVKRYLEFDAMSAVHGTPSKRARLNSGHGRHRASSQQCSPEKISPKQEASSLFSNLTNELTPEKIASNIKDQVDQLSRKKQLRFSFQQETADASEEMADNQTPTTLAAKTSKIHTDFNDKPMFTLEQLSHLCLRKMEEQRQRISEEYDQVLKEKLADQYSAFLRFQHDELKKKIASGDRPSYLN